MSTLDYKNPNELVDGKIFESNLLKIPSPLKNDLLPCSLETGKIQVKKNAIFTIFKIKKINNWTDEEDKKLKEIVENLSVKNWKAVAEMFPGKSPIQCSSRYRRIKPGILKGYWTKDEDDKLMECFQKYGKNWKLIAKEMPHRSGKQIRDRFLNSLDPDLNKKKFSSKEDKLLIILYNKYGPAWSKITKQLKGRSGDMVKNRFFSFIRKKIVPITNNFRFKKRILINNKTNQIKKLSKNYKAKKISETNFQLKDINTKKIENIKNANEVNCVNNISTNNINLNYFDNYFDKIEKEDKNRQKLKIEKSNFAIIEKSIENTKMKKIGKNTNSESRNIKASATMMNVYDSYFNDNTNNGNSKFKEIKEINLNDFVREKFINQDDNFYSNKNLINFQLSINEKYNEDKYNDLNARQFINGIDQVNKDNIKSVNYQSYSRHLNSEKLLSEINYQNENEEFSINNINNYNENPKFLFENFLNLKKQNNKTNVSNMNINSYKSTSPNKQLITKKIKSIKNKKNLSIHKNHSKNLKLFNKHFYSENIFDGLKKNKSQMNNLSQENQIENPNQNIFPNINNQFNYNEICQEKLLHEIQKADKINFLNFKEKINFNKDKNIINDKNSASSQLNNKTNLNFKSDKNFDFETNYDFIDKQESLFLNNKRIKHRKLGINRLSIKKNKLHSLQKFLSQKKLNLLEIKDDNFLNYKTKNKQTNKKEKFISINNNFSLTDGILKDNIDQSINADSRKTIVNQYNKEKVKKAKKNIFKKQGKNNIKQSESAVNIKDLNTSKAAFTNEKTCKNFCKEKNVLNSCYNNLNYNFMQYENQSLDINNDIKPNNIQASYLLSSLFLADLRNKNQQVITKEIKLFESIFDKQKSYYKDISNRLFDDFLIKNKLDNFVFSSNSNGSSK